jgi:CheY-like chemotaxis protein
MGPKTEQRVVLLAEDDVLVRNFVRHILKAAGFLVLAAADANEALELSRICQHRIHLLLTDVDMPGMNGLALAEEITRERADTIVLFMSGGTRQVIPETVPYITKPFTPKALIRKLEELLTEHNDRPEHI